MQVRLYANLRDAARTSKVELDLKADSTVRQLLAKLFEVHPELEPEIMDDNSELKPFVNVFINGRGVRWMKGLDTTLEFDAEVAIFPPVAGGSPLAPAEEVRLAPRL